MTNTDQYSPIVAFDKSAVISSSGTTSAEIDLRGTTLCGLFIPSSIDGTELSFQVAFTSGGTFYDMRDAYNNKITVQITAGDFASLDPSSFAGVQFLKVISNATETAQRTIELAARGI